MMEHAGIHREPVALAFCQKAQISCISSQTVSLGLKIPLIWSFLYSQVPRGFQQVSGCSIIGRPHGMYYRYSTGLGIGVS